MSLQLPVWKKWLSYLWPVRVDVASTPANPVLQLAHYRGAWQLLTEHAMYSDTKSYRPVQAVFAVLDEQLSDLQQVLVLGGGLGSMVHMLNKLGLRPEVKLVELDGQIAYWCDELLPPGSRARVVCEDASRYVAHAEAGKFDLLFIDLFKGLIPLSLAGDSAFLLACKRLVAKGGFLAINYIREGEEETESMRVFLEKEFESLTGVRFEVNQVFVAGGPL